MAARKLLLSLLVVSAMGALLVARTEKDPAAGTAMIGQAQSFLGTLSDEQKQQATFEYDSPERLNWHFIPRERKGLPLKAMKGETRKAAVDLLRSGLSQIGYEQARDVMSLEEVLYLLEEGDEAERRLRRDPQNYYISVFGKPDVKGTWGWRFEGHHLSLNYSIEDGTVVATTPEFFGANPGRIEAGPERTLRVLAPEEDIARQLLKLATPGQQETMWLDKTAPDDIRGGGEAQPATTEPVGLAAANMSEDQQKLLSELLNEYRQNMPAEVAQQRWEAIREAGFEKIHFAWWGSDEINQRHAYRVQGPTFLIEYNNTQNNANHVHSIWRDLHGDFNIPLEK